VKIKLLSGEKIFFQLLMKYSLLQRSDVYHKQETDAAMQLKNCVLLNNIENKEP
jgi:hypothetical protein